MTVFFHFFGNIIEVLVGCFIIAVLWGVIRPSEKKPARLRGLVLLLASALGIALLISAAQSAGQGGIFIVMMIPPVAALLAVGLGLVVGSACAMISRKPRRYAVVGLTLFAPLAVTAYMAIRTDRAVAAHEAERAAELAAFQMTDVEGTMASHAIRLPASPQIAVVNECVLEGRTRPANCWTRFALAAGLRGTYDEPPAFVKIEIEGRPRDCPPEATDCPPFKDWCARRPDRATSVWCVPARTPRIVLDTLPLVPIQSQTHQRWERIATLEPSLDLFCRAHWTGRFCEFHMEPAAGVFASVVFRHIGNEDAPEFARFAHGYVDDLWSEIQRE